MAQNPMLKFINTPSAMPPKRKAGERVKDHHEIYQEFEAKSAKDQSARCSQCGVPFCQIGCPLGNNIPDWLMLTATDRLEEAYQLSQATSVLPEICGRICPQDRLCEGVCVLEQSDHGTVTIGAIEKYISDTAFEKGWVKPIKPDQERKESVGIIGSGPAAMAAAARLREKGWQVTIYERADRAGGLLIYGIPGFKLEKPVVKRRIDWLKDSGVTFKLNCEIGKDIDFADLQQTHDAVLVATGVYKARDMNVKGRDLGGVYAAMDFLTTANRLDLGDKVKAYDTGELSAKDKNVVVIGGGDTAMDCVRTAVRQGAKSVQCLYRRDRENMPGSKREVNNAEEEGVKFAWLSQPTEFIGKDKVQAVKVQSMRLGDADASGRRAPVSSGDDPYEMKADMVIMALGFDAEDLPSLWNQSELPISKWGTIEADPKGRTAMEGVYGAGDIVRGASLVVWAVVDGQEVASEIDAYLTRKAEPALIGADMVAA